MEITSVVVRQRVDDLDAAVPFYEKLTGQTSSPFDFGGLRLASVGQFLLFSGPDEVATRFATVSATLTVTDLNKAINESTDAGAKLVAPVMSTPRGRRAVLRHPQGACTSTWAARTSTGAA